MSTAQNNIAVERADRILVPIATTVAINQGDFVKIASKLGVAYAGSSDKAIGISDETNPVASLGGDVNPNLGGAAAAVMVIPIPPYKGAAIAYLPILTGDAPGFFDSLYRTADAQILTTTAGSGPVRVGRCLELVAFADADSIKRAKVLLCGNA